MVLKLVRFISLICAALIAGIAFCHALELPNKMTLPAETWLTVQQILYRGFGAKAGPIEVGAVVSSLMLLFLVRKRRSAFVWSLIASVCFVAGLVLWFQVINPMNLLIDSWTGTTLPTNWTAARDQWEYGHVAHATLFILGLIASVIAILADTTTSSDRREKSSTSGINESQHS